MLEAVQWILLSSSLLLAVKLTELVVLTTTPVSVLSDCDVPEGKPIQVTVEAGKLRDVTQVKVTLCPSVLSSTLSDVMPSSVTEETGTERDKYYSRHHP